MPSLGYGAFYAPADTQMNNNLFASAGQMAMNQATQQNQASPFAQQNSAGLLNPYAINLGSTQKAGTVNPNVGDPNAPWNTASSYDPKDPQGMMDVNNFVGRKGGNYFDNSQPFQGLGVDEWNNRMANQQRMNGYYANTGQQAKSNSFEDYKNTFEKYFSNKAKYGSQASFAGNPQFSDSYFNAAQQAYQNLLTAFKPQFGSETNFRSGG